MERLTRKEVERAQEKFVSDLKKECALVISMYRKLKEASFINCKNAIINSYETGQLGVSDETKRKCDISTNKIATNLEIKCHEVLSGELQVSVDFYRTLGSPGEENFSMKVDITPSVTPIQSLD